MKSPYATSYVSVIVTSYPAPFPIYGGLLVQFLPSTGWCLPLTYLFGVKTQIWDEDIWPQETIIALSYG